MMSPFQSSLLSCSVLISEHQTVNLSSILDAVVDFKTSLDITHIIIITYCAYILLSL